MSAIDQAQARLDAALDRLERAIATRRERDSAAAAEPGLEGEVEGLRDECSQLRERLAAAETRHARLKEAMMAMSGRLDVAIAELDGLMQDRAAE